MAAKYKQECVFGLRAIMEAIKDEKDVEKVLIRQGSRGELFSELFDLIREKRISYQFVPPEYFRPFADRNHQGVLAEISPIPYQDLDEVLDTVIPKDKVPLILILDRVTDVHNFGAIVRSAECAGVDAVIIPNKHSAKISMDSIKTSAGAMYHIPVCRILNLKRLIRTLRFDRNYTVYAANEKTDKYYTDVDYSGPTAIIMGSEENGVDSGLLNLSTEMIKIPQMGKIESLNVSVATSVIIFEALRQRGLNKK